MPVEELLSGTVKGYVDWFAEQNYIKKHSLFFNVPAPCYKVKQTSEANKKVKSTIELFNSLLHRAVLSYDFNIIDVYKFTAAADGFSNRLYHIDDYHLSSGAIPEIEKQIGTFV